MLREHAFLMLFCATSAAAARVLGASWNLDSFAGRAIGQSTLENVSVGARTSVYVQTCILFVAVALVVGLVMPRLVRWLGAGVGRALEATSVCGLLLLLMAAWRVDTHGTLSMVVGGQVLIVAPAVIDRVFERLLRRPREVMVRDAGAYAAWIGGCAFALLEPLVDFGVQIPGGFARVPALVVLVAIGLDFVRRFWCALPIPASSGGASSAGSSSARAAQSDRFVFALTPLAALAAARIVRNELYLLANARGHLAVRPEQIEIGFCVIVAVWCAARALRGPRTKHLLADGRVDVERLVGRFTFPWILCGVAALTHFSVMHMNSPEFLEPANGGLMIQQFYDFGRLPFFETFGAHGLTDCFFGFVFAGLTGFRESTWAEFDYLAFVLTLLVTYHILRAWWSSAAAGLFCVLVLPRLNDFLPDYCVLIGISVFVLRWVAQRRTASSWAVFAGWITFVFVWRLDMGFANALGSIATLAALVVLMPEYRPPIGAMVRGSIGFALVFVAGCLLVCAVRGIDPIGRLGDFLAVIGSNQAFGYPRIAGDRHEVVLVHTFVFPILVLTTCIAVLVRMRGRVEWRDKVFFAVLGTVFFGAYYLANFPRGLVRHSFLELSSMMLSSFAFMIIAGSWRWWFTEERRVAAFGLFFFTSAAMTHELNVGAIKGHKPLGTTTTYERLAYAMRATPRVEYSDQRIERTMQTPWIDERTRDILSFFAKELRADETFLDLSNSPLLYFHAHKRSPHWLNHTLLVYGERLQKSFIAQLQDFDLPFVVLSSLEEVTKDQALPYLDVLDTVPFTLRQYRMYEWVYARYVPLSAFGRWIVWVRKDRMLAESPAIGAADRGSDAAQSGRRLLTLDDVSTDPGPSGEAVSVHVLSRKEAHFKGPIALAQDRVQAVHVRGSASRAAVLDVALGFGGEQDVAPATASLAFPAEHADRWYWIPRSDVARSLTSLSLQTKDAFDLDALELWEFDDPDCRKMDADLDKVRTTDLAKLAWLWGEYDTAHPAPQQILRALSGTETDATRDALLPASGTDGEWAHGIRRDQAAFRVSPSDRDRKVAVGDRMLFSASGVRAVTSVDAGVVRVEGANLDAERDGNPRVVRFVAAGAQGGTLTKPKHPLLYAFEPVPANDRIGGNYLRLRLRSSGAQGVRMVVAYGAGARSVGRFLFDLRADDQAHDYLVRISTQANWTLHDCDWLRLIPSMDGVEVIEASITAGD